MEKYKKDLEKIFKKIYIILYVVSIVSFAIGICIQNENILIVSMLMIFISIICFCIEKMDKRLILLIFMICFFTFIMGQYVTVNNGVHLYRSEFSKEIRNHTIICIYLSLLFLSVGSILMEKLNKREINNNNEYFLSNNNDKLKKISKCLFLITIIFAFISKIERVIYAIENGYLGYMLNFESNLPFVLNYIGTFGYIFFYIFLSTLPKKKELLIPIVIYIVYLLLGLLTGSRNGFVLGIISLVIYCFIRDKQVSKEEKLISKKKIIVAVAILPIIVVLLNVFNSTRNGIKIGQINVFQQLNDFFTNQGSSVAVISLGKEYEEQLKDKRYPYIFYSVVEEIEGKFNQSIYKPIKDDDDIQLKLYNKNSLATKISYFYYGDKILKGNGLGTSYIAEAYADGGYLCVIVINLIFGILINLFNKGLYKNWILCTVILMIMLKFMYVPRDPTFNWFNTLTAVNMWVGILVMYIITKKKSTKYRGGYNENIMDS